MDVTGNPNIPLFVFAVCQTLGGAILILVPLVQRLSRNTQRDRKQSNIRLVEEAKKMIENEKVKEVPTCIENGRLSVPKSPTKGISGAQKF